MTIWDRSNLVLTLHVTLSVTWHYSAVVAHAVHSDQILDTAFGQSKISGWLLKARKRIVSSFVSVAYMTYAHAWRNRGRS